MQPRPYQVEAIDALNAWMPANDGNPCIVLPTGSGKTPCMAWLIQQYVSIWPETRILILAHVRELLTQGVEKMHAIWPLAPVGVYSAGLGRKDRWQNITYAGIQSIWKKACDFDPFDLIFVDEAHRIPLKGETMYRKFIADAKLVNPNVRVVGWTATPYRLDGGPICGPKHILNQLIYEADVKRLVDQGYLCRLRSKGGDATPDVSNVHIRKGEFVQAELEEAADAVVEEAVAECVPMLEGRNAILFFCVGVDHAYDVSGILRDSHDIDAPVIHAGTPKDERDSIIRNFTAGKLRAVCNVNVLSEGFDAQRIDAVVMLRPTASPGLYYQQVGRGLRLHPSKTDCLVLDFAGNIERHGPIDDIYVRTRKKKDKNEKGSAPIKKCPKCKEYVAANAKVCPICEYKFPPKHDVKASEKSILSVSEPWVVDVTDVSVSSHRKSGSDHAVLRVDYYGGLERHTEWVCIEHPGYAGAKAAQWWRRRFGDPAPTTVQEALSDLFLAHKLDVLSQRIKVRQAGKYTEIIEVEITDEHRSAIASS